MNQIENTFPVLNEDVLGIILKFVVKYEQNRLLETKMCFSEVKDIDLHVEWPEILQLNSQRLVHHTNVKLLSKTTLYFDFWKCSFHASPAIQVFRPFRAVDNFCEDWQTMKHFGSVTVRTLNGMPTYKLYNSPIDLVLSNLILRGMDQRSEAIECNICRVFSRYELKNSENDENKTEIRNQQEGIVLPGRRQIRFVSD